MSAGALHYFAYGSNLLRSRMRRRIAVAEVAGRGWLGGYRVRFDKRGMDGTAKANLVPCGSGRVWGAIYRLPAASLSRLDAIEGGYRRVAVTVHGEGGPQPCFTYLSERVDARQRVALWYAACVLDGAVQMRLPQEHVRALREAADERRG